MKAAKEELKSSADQFSPDLKKAILNLYEISNVNQPIISSIALQGRIIAEICVSRLLDYWLLVPKLATLEEKIKAVPLRHLNGRTWILSYLRLLQSCGNWAAHPNEQVLITSDAAAVLIAALRVVEYTDGITSGRIN